jgi:hypothetical protein
MTPEAPGPETEAWRSGGREANALFELAKSWTESTPHEVEEEAEQQFLAAFRRELGAPSRAQTRKRWTRVAGLGAALAVAACVLLAVGLRVWSRNAALSYRISQGKTDTGEPINATGGDVDVRFSDGTAVTVERGARARVLATTARGAHLQLEGGRMAFDVVPRQNRGDWCVDAGPYRVHVTGTVFAVEWNAAQALFQVEVSRGHVVVEGAGVRKELSAGEVFRQVGTPAAAVAVAAGQEAAQVKASEPLGVEHVLAPPLSRDNAASWSRQVATGRYDTVIAAAERRGVPSCLAACSLDDLKALADAARLSSHAALAEQALLAERKRFAGSSEAKAAAFLLGRLNEARSLPRAVAWYDTYLSESPNARFSGDALGRKMVLKAGADPLGSRAAASEYLRRFPGGPYADHARGIVQASDGGR